MAESYPSSSVKAATLATCVALINKVLSASASAPGAPGRCGLDRMRRLVSSSPNSSLAIDTAAHSRNRLGTWGDAQ